MKADPIIISTGFFYSAYAWQLVRMAQSGHFNSSHVEECLQVTLVHLRCKRNAFSWLLKCDKAVGSFECQVEVGVS